MEILKEYQPDIMLILSGICAIMALFVYMTNTMSKRRKLILMCQELSAMFLLIADRRAYIFRGNTTDLGWVMVRLSNCMVFILTLVVIYCFNEYLIDLLTHEGGLKAAPKRLKAARILGLVGIAMVIISQYTGLYYTFDEFNQYQRAPGFFISYMFPMAILLLAISVVLQYRKNLSRTIWVSLLLFVGLSIAVSVLQIFLYGVSLNNMAIVTLSALLYVFALKDMGREVAHARKLEIEFYKEGQKREHALFEQTAEALATAIDAKDKYTHGHSTRVAQYSTQIAREAGKSEEECEKVYFAALLHDVGKIGVPDAVINKDGKLTDEEFAQIKLHPVYGNQILASIQQSPYLSIGAHYHHERYDGRGYPEGLKGDDIPDIARIISVADAYDAMTSKRSYRDPIPQQTVREELIKGMGTQFDPEYAKIMLHLIDLDIEYGMRERSKNDESATSIHCEKIYHERTIGIPINAQFTRIQFSSRPDESKEPDTYGRAGSYGDLSSKVVSGSTADSDRKVEFGSKVDSGRKTDSGRKVDPNRKSDNHFLEMECLPTLVLFDALDGRVHEEEAKKKDLHYYEYGQIRVDGRTKFDGVRNVKVRTLPGQVGSESVLDIDSANVSAGGAMGSSPRNLAGGAASSTDRSSSGGVAGGSARFSKTKKSSRWGTQYVIEAVRVKDHAMIRISDDEKTVEYIIALPDSSRYLYISLTGEHCTISNIRQVRDSVSVEEDYIPRIAEEISYIKDRPQGDIPNTQIDGWRTQSTEGVLIKDSMQMSFHTQSLPTARLVWHCPFVSIYSSKDGSVNGEDYREYLLLRLDGETWESDTHAENNVIIDHTREFPGWNTWKDENKKGMDCQIAIQRDGNCIAINTENLGIAINSQTTIKDDISDIYVALTGDQCALTNIKLSSQ